MRLLILLFSVLVLSCNTPINPKDCEEIDRIEVFSVGFPNLTFSVNQTEKDVRMNPQGIIKDSNSLRKIESLLKDLKVCKNETKPIVSIVGICDFYCKGGKKYTLIYDSFSTKINDDFYCENKKLINALFEK